MTGDITGCVSWRLAGQREEAPRCGGLARKGAQSRRREGLTAGSSGQPAGRTICFHSPRHSKPAETGVFKALLESLELTVSAALAPAPQVHSRPPPPSAPAAHTEYSQRGLAVSLVSDEKWAQMWGRRSGGPRAATRAHRPQLPEPRAGFCAERGSVTRRQVAPVLPQSAKAGRLVVPLVPGRAMWEQRRK